MNLSKRDLINSIFLRLSCNKTRKPDFTKSILTDVSELIFEELIYELKQQNTIQIRGLGTFYFKKRKPKRVRDINTKNIIEIKSKTVILFKPSKNLDNFF